MRKNRPEGYSGTGDTHLVQLSRELQQVLRETQRTFAYDSLRLRKHELKQLAEILVEFAEDIHNNIGIWASYEQYNRQFFGMLLPFLPSNEEIAGIHIDRIRHLLWILYPEIIPNLITSPRHQDLERIAESASAFLNAAFRRVPKDSGIKKYLQTSNQYGWEVKRKLIWLGTQSYLFRMMFLKYLDENNRGRWDIGHVDDFLCQECTPWSGLGPIDILAGVLDIDEAERRELRGWYERHAAFYRVLKVECEHIETLNVISDQPYRLWVESPEGLFKPGQLVFGSLVSWRGEWYFSGEQEIWTNTASIDVEDLRDTMRRKNSAILCRFWKEYEEQVQERAKELHEALLAYHGKDLVVYPDGLAMAADWQKEMRHLWESRPPEEIRKVVQKHGLTRNRPDVNIPPDMLNHKQGIGVFLNPEEGKEIMGGFHPLLEGLKRQGRDLAEDEEQAIQQFVDSDAVSPAFVKCVLVEYGQESVRTAFRLPEDAPEYWLEYLLRSRKGHFFRKRYPSVSVV